MSQQPLPSNAGRVILAVAIVVSALVGSCVFANRADAQTRTVEVNLVEGTTQQILEESERRAAMILHQGVTVRLLAAQMAVPQKKIDEMAKLFVKIQITKLKGELKLAEADANGRADVRKAEYDARVEELEHQGEQHRQDRETMRDVAEFEAMCGCGYNDFAFRVSNVIASGNPAIGMSPPMNNYVGSTAVGYNPVGAPHLYGSRPGTIVGSTAVGVQQTGRPGGMPTNRTFGSSVPVAGIQQGPAPTQTVGRTTVTLNTLTFGQPPNNYVGRTPNQ